MRQTHTNNKQLVTTTTPLCSSNPHRRFALNTNDTILWSFRVKREKERRWSQTKNKKERKERKEEREEKKGRRGSGVWYVFLCLSRKSKIIIRHLARMLLLFFSWRSFSCWVFFVISQFCCWLHHHHHHHHDVFCNPTFGFMFVVVVVVDGLGCWDWWWFHACEEEASLHCEDRGLVLLQCWCEDCGLVLLQCCCEDFVGCFGCKCCFEDCGLLLLQCFCFEDCGLLLLQCCFADYVWVYQTPDDCNLFVVRKRRERNRNNKRKKPTGYTHRQPGWVVMVCFFLTFVWCFFG